MATSDFARMRLACKGEPHEMHRILQLEMRKRHAAKLHQTLQSPGFEFPDSLSGEQCTSDDIAQLHTLLIDKGDKVLDLTCGLGIDAFHMAGKAASVTACELKSALVGAARHNAKALGIANFEIMEGDGIGWLANSNRHFDVIFIDPARRDIGGNRVHALTNCSPDVTSCLDMLLSRCRRLIIKASPMLDVSHTLHELHNNADIMVYGTATECKELTAILPGTGRITATTSLSAGDSVDFSFNAAEETDAEAELALPSEGEYVAELYPAAIKAGALRLAAQRFGMKKVSANSHLYISPAPQPGFPGKFHKVQAVVPFNKKGIKLVKEICESGADIAVRNMKGISANELRQRLGVPDGGSHRIYGATSPEGGRVMIVCRR